MSKNKLDKVKQKNKIRKGDLIFYIALLILPMAHLAVFYFGTNANSFLLGFKKYDMDTGLYFFDDGSAFRQVFYDLGNAVVQKSFLNALLVYAVGLFITTPLSVLSSYYIYKNYPGSSIFRVVIFLPTIIAGIILVIIFKYFVGRFVPEVGGALGADWTNLLSQPDKARPIILFFEVVVGFGGNTLLYVGTMKNINESVVEAARLDGVTPIGEVIHVVLPAIWPTFVTFLVGGLVGLFSNQMSLFSLYGKNADSSIWTIGYYLFVRTNESLSYYPYLAAFGLLLTFIVAPLTIGVRAMLNRFGPREE